MTHKISREDLTEIEVFRSNMAVSSDRSGRSKRLQLAHNVVAGSTLYEVVRHGKIVRRTGNLQRAIDEYNKLYEDNK